MIKPPYGGIPYPTSSIDLQNKVSAKQHKKGFFKDG
jgi:hypothetical protein